jgi:phage shock protein PspC (stress-responsive transcriptional regulator)
MSSPYLQRPLQGRVIAGVCGALAVRFGMDVPTVRLIMLLLGLFTGFGVLLYICCWIAIPSQQSR